MVRGKVRVWVEVWVKVRVEFRVEVRVGFTARLRLGGGGGSVLVATPDFLPLCLG